MLSINDFFISGNAYIERLNQEKEKRHLKFYERLYIYYHKNFEYILLIIGTFLLLCIIYYDYYLPTYKSKQSKQSGGNVFKLGGSLTEEMSGNQPNPQSLTYGGLKLPLPPKNIRVNGGVRKPIPSSAPSSTSLTNGMKVPNNPPKPPPPPPAPRRPLGSRSPRIVRAPKPPPPPPPPSSSSLTKGMEVPNNPQTTGQPAGQSTSSTTSTNDGKNDNKKPSRLSRAGSGTWKGTKATGRALGRGAKGAKSFKYLNKAGNFAGKGLKSAGTYAKGKFTDNMGDFYKYFFTVFITFALGVFIMPTLVLAALAFLTFLITKNHLTKMFTL